MHVTAQNLKVGDRIRGLGLTVVFVEPQTDHLTSVEGAVGHSTDQAPVTLVLPNEHRVNVRRLFAVGDTVTVRDSAFLVDDFDVVVDPFVQATVTDVDAEQRTVTLRREDGSGKAETTVVPFASVRHARPIEPSLDNNGGYGFDVGTTL